MRLIKQEGYLRTHLFLLISEEIIIIAIFFNETRQKSLQELTRE